ncbi:JAB domain-containing protein [Altererythrobacter sp.]|nr:JAB domain-containing protein [Altererythrobacter sp.]
MGVFTRIKGEPRLALPSDLPDDAVANSSDPVFLRYLHSRFADASEERLHVVYCDAGQRYLFDETHVIGGAHSLTLRARPLVHRALALGASGLILAHNHLSGVCRPSPADITATHNLQLLGSALELSVIDHLIFTRQRVFSMLAGGYL